jgi:hypothetical protein
MKGLKRQLAIGGIILVWAAPMFGQTADRRRVSSLLAIMTTPLDSKNAVVGQEVRLTTISDVVVDREIVIPKGSSVIGHITKVVTKGKDGASAALAVVIDKAVTSGADLAVQAIIAAAAAPRDTSLTSDPTYGMMHSNEPKMAGSATSAAGTGTLPASSKSSSTAAVATAELKGAMDSPLLLDENSQGAIGYDGMSISWSLASPPPVTIFTTRSKNLKLFAGTQILLRMVPPHRPK